MARQRATYVLSLFGCAERPAVVPALLAALQLLQQTRTRYPVLAMLTGTCCRDAALAAVLRDAGVNRTCVDPIDGIACSGVDRSTVFGSYRNETYAKLHVWALTEYEVALSLDTDVAVMRNIDGVLDRTRRCFAARGALAARLPWCSRRHAPLLQHRRVGSAA